MIWRPAHWLAETLRVDPGLGVDAVDARSGYNKNIIHLYVENDVDQSTLSGVQSILIENYLRAGLALRINNCGRGIHRNEVKGVETLRDALPADWFAFTNLDLVIDAGTAREVDMIIISPRYVFIVDLKNWSGKVSGSDGHWSVDGKDMGSSPVAKICEIERNLYILLKEELSKHQLTRALPVPKIIGLTVFIQQVDKSGIPAAERGKVLWLDEFVNALRDDQTSRDKFGNVAKEFLNRSLIDSFWKQRLTNFFNAGSTSPLQPGRRKFERYIPEDASEFEHPNNIYREYSAREAGTPPSLGTLRLWDFSEVKDARFQMETGRKEIAGRERRVYHWLRDRSESLDRYVLAPKTDDEAASVRYWEIFDRRKRLKRLSDWIATEFKGTRPNTRVELVRQLLTSISEFHKVKAAHLDLGSHSIWVETPTTVKLSHLFAASHDDVRSMGPDRYNFLASVQLPEDILGAPSGDPLRRDVYLAGVAAHQIIFGEPPQGDPPEWNPDVDTASECENLHSWFAQALDLDQSARFANARSALEALNSATIERPTKEEIRLGLERLASEVGSQRKLFAAYPVDGEPLKETNAVDIWRSTKDGTRWLVKLWKQPAWGDFEKEGKRILAFLERALEFRADRLAGLPQVAEVLWLSDSFAVIQEWIDGDSLESVIASPPDHWKIPEGAIRAVQALESRISTLHEQGFAHGDLKPDNIILSDGLKFSLIDVVDFSPMADGEIQNRRYSAGGDRFERDRYAVLKIAEEILLCAVMPEEMAASLTSAIETCRSMSPRLSTLTPLAEALEAQLYTLSQPLSAQNATIKLHLSGRKCQPGILEPEEGTYYLRMYGKLKQPGMRVYIRGAFEELEFRFDDAGKAVAVNRQPITPTKIAVIERHEIFKFQGEVAVLDSVKNDFQQFDELMVDPSVLEAQSHRPPTEPAEADEEERDELLPEENVEEGIIEELAATAPTRDAVEIDVPTLWRQLIDTEKELTTEAIALADSSYDHQLRRHKVPMDLESGVFDFDRNDAVEVQRLHNGSWRRLGELDLSRSTAEGAVIDAYQYGYGGALVEADQRLRFLSHFEAESLKRRAGAVDRILAGDGRASGLVSVFDPASGVIPMRNNHVVRDEDLDEYDLNEDQKDALRTIATVRPVGLLQGPPGTGKTRFIAALAHYAITSGLAKNVLLSSQSHEAVNTAGETLLKLFRKSGGEPSALRVGMNEDQVSDAVRPFHTLRVEQALKDRFDSSFDARMTMVGATLGLKPQVVSDVLIFERNAVPIARRVTDLRQNVDRDDSRIASIVATLKAILERLDLSPDYTELLDYGADEFVNEALVALVNKHRSLTVSEEKIARLRSAIAIGTDFVTSTSNHFRSFEPFLAATRQIVLGTCVGLGRASLGLVNTAFDLVIIDEAARCTASELLVPLQAARWAVLVGDQAQLDPLHRGEVVREVRRNTQFPLREIKRSDFDRVFSSSYGEIAGARLKTQYRMLEPIGRLVSEAFYPDLRLRAGRSEAVLPSGCLPEGFDRPLMWVNTSGLKEQSFESPGGKTGSRINKVEADAIVLLLERWHQHDAFKTWLTNQTTAPFGVGVICMYAAQRDLIRRKILRSPLAAHLDRHIKVGTVDSYQGKENPIVLLSLVRNNRDGSKAENERLVAEGFLSTPNRINVAASRAMDRLVIFGTLDRWPKAGPMSDLTQRFQEASDRGNAQTIQVSSFLNRNFQRKEVASDG